MSQSLKIMVAGDVEGKFSQLFNRVSSIQKKAGAFDLLLCVGDFFGSDPSAWEPYKHGSAKVPIQTLILGPNEEKLRDFYPEQDGAELCDQVTHLGRRGVYVSSSGLKIAYLSGVDGHSTMATFPVTFSTDDISALLVAASDSSYKGVDILLTSPWPRAPDKYAQTLEGTDGSRIGSEVISQLAMIMKPRYHFCAMEGIFYERQPYRNHKVLQQSANHVTRLIAMAKVGNAAKHKFLYAFNMTPMCHISEEELVKQPLDVTECPYESKPGMLTSKKSDKKEQFFYDQKLLDDPNAHKGKKRTHDKHEGRPFKQPKPTGPCWFCLGSPEVEKHLVVSVGTQCYLALAKGGLTPDHVLILPIGHHQSTVSAPQDVLQEIEKYKSSLKKYFGSKGSVVVFFERNFKTQHLQIQVVPVPVNPEEPIKETFQNCALVHNMELHEIPKLSDLKQIVPEGAPYFYTELPNGDKLLHRINRGFPLNFGREVLADATILNLPERVDWRDCKLSKEQEIQYSKTFRADFSKFDFNIS